MSLSFADKQWRGDWGDALQALLNGLDTRTEPVEVFFGVIKADSDAERVWVVDVLIHVADRQAVWT